MKYDLGVLEIDNFYLSKKYEQELDDEKRKLNGIYYTPKIIVDYIMFKTLKEHDIVENPYLKILDFSCGCGNFLLEAYDILYALFEENIESLNKKYKDEYWCIDNIHEHIIENCIYGVDIDAEALELLKNSLYQKNDKECDNYQFNIYCEDGLKKKWEFKFDYIVGNPPYIGHKLLNKEYKKYLLKEYKEVYKDKSDLYFCFYKKAIDIIKDDGLICMITPRYFLQSPSGTYLRTYIKEKMHIKEIVDFLGTEVFKSVGIASCILTLKNEKENKINNINILKIKNESLKINEYEKLDYLLEENFENYKFNQSLLNEDWLIANEEDKKFYDNIEGKCICYLGDIVNSFQGIITGCDKAFIINKSNEHIGCIPQSILKVWIKNKNIKKYTINDSELRLIYSNDLDYIDEYKDEIINKFIINYKEKLENRRECKKNFRKWYELQWGREKKSFEQVKIMYPYKSKCNKFAIDYNNSYCSADVYSFSIKEDYTEEFSYEYLIGLLNSEIYDRYFKINAKNMGKDIYDYYPNKVMNIKIFKDKNYKKIEILSKKIIEIAKNGKILKEEEKQEKINKLEIQINKLIKKSLQI